jgi:hypothetical protein
MICAAIATESPGTQQDGLTVMTSLQVIENSPSNVSDEHARRCCAQKGDTTASIDVSIETDTFESLRLGWQRVRHRRRVIHADLAEVVFKMT